LPVNRSELLGRSTILTYSKEWRFWYEGLANLNLGDELWQELNFLVTTTLKCEHCFILVKDSLRSSLRIFVPANFLTTSDVRSYIERISWREIKGERDKIIKFRQKQFHYDCLRARVPEKFSVAGHVWYRGLPEVINFGETSEGLMMTDELDLSLGLKALYYHPFITEDESRC